MSRLLIAVSIIGLLFVAAPLFAQESEDPAEQEQAEPEQPVEPEDEVEPETEEGMEAEESEEEEGPTVQWEESLESALENAKKNDSMVMVYFYVPTLDSCRESCR